MRGLKCDRTASVVIGAHAFMQNLRRGHYELVVCRRFSKVGPSAVTSPAAGAPRRSEPPHQLRDGPLGDC